jgi:hypothetical protein
VLGKEHPDTTVTDAWQWTPRAVRAITSMGKRCMGLTSLLHLQKRSWIIVSRGESLHILTRHSVSSRTTTIRLQRRRTGGGQATLATVTSLNVPSVGVEVFEDNVLAEDPIFDDFEHVLYLVVDELSHRDANCYKSVPETGNNQSSIGNSQMESSSSKVYSFVSGAKRNTSTHATILSPLVMNSSTLWSTLLERVLGKSLRKRAQ